MCNREMFYRYVFIMLNFNYCKFIFEAYQNFTFSLKYLCQKMVIAVNIIKNNKHAFNSL